MLEIVMTNLVKPLAGRIGTMAATALIGLGVNGPLAQQVAVGVTAVGLIAGDLALSWLGRRQVEKKTVQSLVGYVDTLPRGVDQSHRID